MGLFDRLRAERARAKAAAQATVVTEVPGFRLFNGRFPMRDPKVRGELLSYASWVYMAANVIANRCAVIRFKINDVRMLRDGKEERTPVPVHPLYDTLGSGGGRRPNPTTTSFNFRKLKQIDLELTGNAVWLKVRDRLGIPRQFWRLRPDRVIQILDKETGMVAGWAWLGRSHGEVQVYPATDIVHFRYPSPIEDPYWGWSPLRSAAHAFDADQANQIYQTKFFEAGAHLGFIIASKNDVDRETATAVIDAFNEKHQGLDKMWQPVVIGGDANIIPAQALNKDLQAMELMDKTRDILLATYGVPLTKIGLANDINLSNSQALDVTFNRETIAPKLVMDEETMEAELLPDYPAPPLGHWYDIDYDNPVPGDREFELEEDRVLLGAGARTADEVRERRGDTPWGSEYGRKVQVPMGVTLVDPEGAGEEAGGVGPGSLPAETAADLAVAKPGRGQRDDGTTTFDWTATTTRYLRLVEPRIRGIDHTTWDRLTRSLADGVRTGESTDQLARRVRDTFQEATQARSVTIARTEVLGASNAGAIAGYEQAGVGFKGWLATQDDRTRDTHDAADGQVVGLNASFDVGGVSLAYPGDPSGPPEEVINCRCTTVPEEAARAVRWTDAERRAMWRGFDERAAAWEGRMVSSCRAVFADQLRSVLRVLARHDADGKSVHESDVATLVAAGMQAHAGRMESAVAGVVVRLIPAEATLAYGVGAQLTGRAIVPERLSA